MRKFILHTGAFLIGVYFILLAVYATLPYYWGNIDFAKKRAMLSAEQQNYDLIYFGPSAVRREFIPSLFEQELDSSMSAFNFGIPGIYYAEQDYLIRNALEDSLFAGAAYFLLFAQEPKPIQDRHLHRLRISYAMDWQSYTAGVRYFFQMDDWKQVYRYTIMFLENKFFIGAVFDMLSWHFKDINFNDELAEYKGYEPYDWSLAQGTEKAIERKKFLKKNKGNEYIKGYKNKPNSIKQKSSISANQVLLNDLIELQIKVEHAGKMLVTVFEPNMDQLLGDDRLNSIYFGHGLDYPEYFKMKYRWDHLHLNEEGAKIHTVRLAQRFNEQIIGEVIQEERRDERLKKDGKEKSKKSKRKRARRAKLKKRKSA